MDGFRWTKAIAIFFFSFLPVFMAAAQEEKAPAGYETGIYYTIQKGDTLWDISERFYGAPWLWPDLWEENSRIPNPHWIYPGKRIRLYHGKGMAPMAIERNDGEGKNGDVEARVPTEKARRFYIYSSMDRVGFVRENPVNPHGSIFKVRNDKELISTGDQVFIRPLGNEPLVLDERYTVYRTFAPETGFGEKKIKEIQHYLTGIVKIEKIEPQFAAARVIRSFRTIRIDDLVMPYRNRSPRIPIVESEKGIQGKFIASEEQMTVWGDDTVAFIDKGDADGIKPGQFYSVHSQEQAILDRKSVPLTPIDYGTLLVLHTEPATATVLVTWSEKGIQPGAAFRTPVKSSNP